MSNDQNDLNFEDEFEKIANSLLQDPQIIRSKKRAKLEHGIKPKLTSLLGLVVAFISFFLPVGYPMITALSIGVMLITLGAILYIFPKRTAYDVDPVIFDTNRETI